MKYSKSQALSIVLSCAKKYEKELEGRNLLILSTDKYKKIYTLEVTFDGYHFLHLTGLQVDKTVISAKDFYKRCISRRLGLKDFELADNRTTEMKLDALPLLISRNLSANMVGTYNKSMPLLYTDQIAGSVRGGMGFKQNGGSGRYIPNTLLKGDMRDYTTNQRRILITYRKYRNEDKYSEIVYFAKKVDWSKIMLPEEYENLPLPG